MMTAIFCIRVFSRGQEIIFRHRCESRELVSDRAGVNQWLLDNGVAWWEDDNGQECVNRSGVFEQQVSEGLFSVRCPECNAIIDDQGYCPNDSCPNHSVGRDYSAYAEFLSKE